MPRTRKALKSFLFDESIRSSMAVLDQGVRLHPQRHRLEIAPVNNFYPTTPDLYCKTRVTTPGELRKWAGFFVDVKHPAGNKTDARYRLSDGITERYWNAGANDWIAASPNNWNTEQEVCDHIATWPTQAIQIVINLSTTSRTLTPSIREIVLVYETDMNFLEDYVVRSFVATLREELRPISILAITSTGQTAVDLKRIPSAPTPDRIQTPYDIVDVDSVYNDTLDPFHMRPLAGVSYNATTKIASLPAQPVGHRLSLRFVWRPHVVLTESQDFTEIAKIPVVELGAVEQRDIAVIGDRPYALNKASNQGFAFTEGYQCEIQIPLSIITSTGRDLHALANEIDRKFCNNVMLHSRGQDEYYPCRIDTEFYDASAASQRELYTGRFTVCILNALFFPEDAKPITGVQRFRLLTTNVSDDDVVR